MIQKFTTAVATDRNSTLSLKGLSRVAFWTFVPLVAVSLLTWAWAKQFIAHIDLGIIPLTNLHAIKDFVTAALSSNYTAHDSWGPMFQALQILKGPARDQLFQILFFEQKVRFHYPPSSLLPIDLLDHLNLASLRVLNRINGVVFITDVIAFSALALLVMRRTQTLQERDRYASLGALAISAGAAFFFYPLVRAHNLGQIQVWIDFLFTLCCIAWLCNQRMLAGLMLGIACALKPQLGLFLVWAALWREWAFVKGFVIAIAPLTLVSLVRYGFNNHLAYLEVLSFLSRHGEAFWPNQSINGIFNRYVDAGSGIYWTDFVFPEFHGLVYGATIGAFILSMVALFVRPILIGGQATIFDLCISAVCMTIGSPIAWEHHYGIILPVYAVMLGAILREPAGATRTWKAGALAVSWFLTAVHFPVILVVNNTYFEFLEAYIFLGTLVLLPLLFLEAGHSSRGERVPDRVTPAKSYG
jgi:hypothetical protein